MNIIPAKIMICINCIITVLINIIIIYTKCAIIFIIIIITTTIISLIQN